MPNLPSRNPGDDVRAFLASVAPGAQLADATVDPEYPPLLLMRTKHAMAAFAFSNGDVSKSYAALYGGFKKHYAAQQGQWDTLDLAFVFCVRPGFPQLDQFCSNVETDVYFCRKFVVPLTASLGLSLGRLPFLPLAPVPGQSLRPPSAQTFLQQCGVPAPLAKAIVVQHERSPQGIVEDCRARQFGDPRPLTPTNTASIVQSEQSTKPVRIETLEIRNFRAYRKPQTFALGADVTVLYGPNGFGKTSFFDAVDFAITGGIGRVEARRHSAFAKIARHLDSGSEESVVSLTFLCNGVPRKLSRSVSDWKQALLDGRPTDRKAILFALTGGDFPVTDRVENFVSLFRASHLFSQEQQELTKGFQEHCQLPSEIISRMLAFEDYANAVSKASDVRKVVQGTIADATQEIRELSELILADTKELERLGGTARVHPNIKSLDAEIDALRTALKTVGITVTPARPDMAMLRGWRAALESRHSQSRIMNERFSTLAREVAGLPRMRTEVAAVQQHIVEKENAIKAVEEKRIAVELVIQRAEQRLAEMTAKRLATQTHADLLEWVRNTQPSYARLITRQRELSKELQRTTDVLAQLVVAEDKATKELRSREATAVQAAEKLKTRRSELAKFQALSDGISAWQANRTRLATVLQSEQALLNSMELLRSEGRELAPQLAALTSEEARLAHQITEADKYQSELRTLVSQLQGHVRSGTCPLCGEDHGTKDQLLQRIQRHVAADAASDARLSLTGVRERIKQLAERIAANNQKQQTLDKQIATLRNERAKLETLIANFTATASGLTIVMTGPSPTPAEQLQALIAQFQQEVTNLEALVREANVIAKDTRVVATNAKNAVAIKKKEVEEQKESLSRLQDEGNRLRADPRLTQVSLDIEPGQLAELAKLDLQHLDEFKTEATKAETEANQKKTEWTMLRQEATALKAQLLGWRTQLSNLQNAITQITVKLEDLKLTADTNEESLLAVIAEQAHLQEFLLHARDATSSLELAIDAATTAAALTTLKQAVRNREKALAEATLKRDQHVPWLKYFDEVSRLVSSQQNQAIENFIQDYGPRTSVIQRRLRSVYGFDDIEITSRESTISVRVKRNGEELRPTDYFSQSQQQTLLLGLFLTACSSQTWSSFSPVFLDDPVTHFDDLNTYAFLDLVVGLLESEVEKRQFIISTCDEKLLQLARQKFRHLGERAKFYRFTAIGAAGPTIEQSF